MALTCPLCEGAGGDTVAHDARLRVVLPEEPLYPGFTRVIWQTHVAEMTDLNETDRAHLLRVLMAVETAQREAFQPDKINLASLGNVVPHLHWHVIARWRDDTHFPASVWSAPAERDGAPARRRIDSARERVPAYRGLLERRLRECGLSDFG